MKLLYDMGVHGIALGSLLRPKSCKQFLKRCLLNFPIIRTEEHPLIWVHAVSVGETRAVAPLVAKLKNEPFSPRVLISSVTATGHEEAKRSIPQADWHTFLPFDLPYLIKPLVKRVAPDLVLLSETDFWHHFQSAAQERGAKVVLINGKLSEKSSFRMAHFPTFAHELIDSIDAFCVQSALYAERFRKAGVPKNKITVTGNIKLDGFTDEEPLDLGFQPQDLVLTLGSTHHSEEKLCMRALIPLMKRYPHLKVVVVPRHPERFEEVARFLSKLPFSFDRYSTLQSSAPRILLLDAMGLLRQCYRISDIAIVGGSFTHKVGGHNILEPSFYGVPVIFGPHMHQQPDLRDLCLTHQAGIQVTEHNLEATLESFIISDMKRRSYGHRGQSLIQEASGALERTYNLLKQFLPLASKNNPC